MPGYHPGEHYVSFFRSTFTSSSTFFYIGIIMCGNHHPAYVIAHIVNLPEGCKRYINRTVALEASVLILPVHPNNSKETAIQFYVIPNNLFSLLKKVVNHFLTYYTYLFRFFDICKGL